MKLLDPIPANVSLILRYMAATIVTLLVWVGLSFGLLQGGILVVGYRFLWRVPITVLDTKIDLVIAFSLGIGAFIGVLTGSLCLPRSVRLAGAFGLAVVTLVFYFPFMLPFIGGDKESKFIWLVGHAAGAFASVALMGIQYQLANRAKRSTSSNEQPN